MSVRSPSMPAAWSCTAVCNRSPIWLRAPAYCASTVRWCTRSPITTDTTAAVPAMAIPIFVRSPMPLPAPQNSGTDSRMPWNCTFTAAAGSSSGLAGSTVARR